MPRKSKTSSFWNLRANGDALDIQVFGVIDPGFFDGEGAYSAEISAQLTKYADATTVNVHINSVGGDVFGGLAIYNLLRQHPAAKTGNLTTVVEGLAASAASVIAMAGKTRMLRGSMMMIHNPWTIVAGDANDMRTTADMLDSVRDSLLAVYREKTGKSDKELRALLDEETWMTADEAVEEGFADELEDDDVDAQASASAIAFGSVSFPRDRLPMQVLAMVDGKKAHRGVAAMENHMTEDEKKRLAALEALERDFFAFAGAKNVGEAFGAITALKAKAERADAMQVELEAIKAEKSRLEVASLIDEATTDGRVTPAKRTELEALQAKYGTDALRMTLSMLPKAVSAAVEPAPTANAVDATGLNAEQKQILKLTGLSPDKFAEHKKVYERLINPSEEK